MATAEEEEWANFLKRSRDLVLSREQQIDQLKYFTRKKWYENAGMVMEAKKESNRYSSFLTRIRKKQQKLRKYGTKEKVCTDSSSAMEVESAEDEVAKAFTSDMELEEIEGTQNKSSSAKAAANEAVETEAADAKAEKAVDPAVTASAAELAASIATEEIEATKMVEENEFKKMKPTANPVANEAMENKAAKAEAEKAVDSATATAQTEIAKTFTEIKLEEKKLSEKEQMERELGSMEMPKAVDPRIEKIVEGLSNFPGTFGFAVPQL